MPPGRRENKLRSMANLASWYGVTVLGTGWLTKGCLLCTEYLDNVKVGSLGMDATEYRYYAKAIGFR